MKIRIKFRKYGNLKFIGHLDVQRYFQKCVRRAGIDVAYTKGFSPHQIMSFAAPLGIGLESGGEYMDMEVNTFSGSSDTVKRLNEAGVEGIEVLSAKVLPEGAGNAMASVAAAGYTIRFREGREPRFHWKEKLSGFFSQESIMITKETKKSTLKMDIRPGIFDWSLDGDSMYLLVDASSSGNIKPGMVVEAFLQANGDTLKENALLIYREETYMDAPEGVSEQVLSTAIKVSEGKKVLVPLDAIGTVVENAL